ncbi:protein BTG1-like [Onthophagus taurus]|uniref:protein BTG1-like n=1 Tax=Onthophagus taurus TaxID=166361 RepID=UPI000C2076E3|nr:protein BTG1-like [Onthophagus taurus]XP_022904267.1 protein BTG1-like [Onthophagus taurus]XP_022904273.1 protein BTG1-like [Onthophagus taurus]XP_022904281.1 protein BTG1-like [Onthophagus taurus]XP_022904288.1 protein BTG1-like [Onthophagus taurus]
MKEEILAAVMFLIRFIEKSDTFPRDQIENFKNHLTVLLTQRFEKHWFPEVPAKGQGYRCIRVNGLTPVDITLEQAATKCGLRYRDLRLPAELTVWVDPNEVCYRLGESEGSYCTLATFSSETSSTSSSFESSSSSLSSSSLTSSSSESSTPSPSPPTTPLQDKYRRLGPQNHKALRPYTDGVSCSAGKHRNYNMNVTAFRVKPPTRELSFNSYQNRSPWRCDGPPYPFPPVYRNVNYNARHYKNVLRV